MKKEHIGMDAKQWKIIQQNVKMYRKAQPHVENAIKNAFGTSSLCSSMFVSDPSITIDGLTYIRNWISKEEEREIINMVDGRPFSNAIARRQQFWGEIYYHTTHNLEKIQPKDDKLDESLPLEDFHHLLTKLYEPWLIEAISSTSSGTYKYHSQTRNYESTPSGIFQHPYEVRQYLSNTEHDENVNDGPTQILVNEYIHKQGISTHIDDPDAFGRIIVIVSLENPIIMILGRGNTTDIPVVEQKILLEPRSLLVMKGEARYLWRHAIQKSLWLSYPVDTKFRENDEENDYMLINHDPNIDLNNQISNTDQNLNENKKIIHEVRFSDNSTAKTLYKDEFGKYWQMNRRNEDYRRISLTVRRLLPGRKRVDQNDTTFLDNPPPK